MYIQKFLRAGALAITLVVSAVGCSGVKMSSSDSSPEKAVTDKGNGDSYAGKSYSYRIPSLCSDGTDVASVITVTKDLRFLLTRDNCTDLNPAVELTRNQVDLPNDGVTLIYDDRVYVGPPSLAPLIRCVGEGTSVAISDKFVLDINTVDMTVSGALSLRGQDWSFSNQQLKDIGVANPGVSPAHEYYMDQGDATGYKQGFKMIVDLTDTAPIISIIEFWSPGAEFQNARCQRMGYL